MKQRERQQLVEILRCAADPGSPYALFEVAMVRGYPLELADVAYTLRKHAIASGGYVDHGPDAYIATCLEAALQVEEGSWP